MRLQQGLDLLHRRIEEWMEEEMLESELGDSEVEAFGEYGSDLVAFLQEVIEDMEVGGEELSIVGQDMTSRELTEELWEVLNEAWEHIEFAERPVGVRLEELRLVLVGVAKVLDGSEGEREEDLEEVVELLDDYLTEV